MEPVLGTDCDGKPIYENDWVQLLTDRDFTGLVGRAASPESCYRINVIKITTSTFWLYEYDHQVRVFTAEEATIYLLES